jgi:hypothetical protein
MKYLIPLLLATTAFAQTEEKLSGITGSQPMDYDTMYQFPLMHRDGSVVQLKLIKFNKDNCAEVDGEKGCVMGFTGTKNNYKRKVDAEHPVDTTETINLVYSMKGKTPVISMSDFIHESNHACMFHYMSRTMCETNWRYSECMESIAYCSQTMYKDVRRLEKLKLIKLNYE